MSTVIANMSMSLDGLSKPTMVAMSTTVFSGGAVAHVFAAHPRSSPIGNRGADAVTSP